MYACEANPLPAQTAIYVDPLPSHHVRSRTYDQVGVPRVRPRSKLAMFHNLLIAVFSDLSCDVHVWNEHSCKAARLLGTVLR